MPLTTDYIAKARWVIRGNLMDKDFMESYAPVVNEATNKLLFALLAKLGWHTIKGDAVLAFLNGIIDPTGEKRIFMVQPKGYEQGDNDLVCELKQLLYGLVLAARIWYDTLAAAMKDMGFEVSQYDAGLWIHSTKKNLYVTSYVDDFQVVSKLQEDSRWFIKALVEKFDIKTVDTVSKYLGVNIQEDDGVIKLSQADYARDLVNSFGLEDAHPVKLPYDPGLVIDDEFDPSINQEEYQRGTGSLN